MEKFLPYHVPQITDDEINAVTDVLKSGWLTTGPKSEQFEEEFKKYIGVRHALAVNSCTSALHLALAVFDIKENDEVIVPTMTFTATAEAVEYLRAKPVLIDCEEGTLNLNPSLLESKITDKTKAIIPVHYAGHPCDMDPILKIAKKYGLKVIEDAAHALPSFYHSQKVGTLGDAACFSFYATKTITTGEGGMLTTNCDEVLDRMKILRLHGMSKNAMSRYGFQGQWHYEVLESGFKYNLTDILAALGIAQLRKCDQFQRIREKHAQQYTEGFQDIPEIKVLIKKEDIQHSWHLFVIQLQLEKLVIDRDQFMGELKKRNIGTTAHFIPLHMHPYYHDKYGYKQNDFPVASKASQRVISLPIYPKMTEEDVKYVVQSIKTIVRENRKS